LLAKTLAAEIVIAQFTDCHLFADINGLHHGANVYQNLLKVLSLIAQDKNVDIIVFTGDLTQDHSKQSYVNFVQAVHLANIVKPFYFLAGNHDEFHLLNHYLTPPPFEPKKFIESEHWQICLLNTKSATPAGFVSEQSLLTLCKNINRNKKQLLFTHHHPIDVNYFIDKHGLANKPELWQALEKSPSITAIACGHVHRALDLVQKINDKTIQVLTCPATSIQFDPQAETVKALETTTGQGIGYRRINLYKEGYLTTQVIFC
jgi:Icc protein